MDIEVLAVGAHPDDVELTLGGTLAKLAAAGRTTAILDLTRGEMGSRGTPEQRAKEAEAAGRVLGISKRITLDLSDGMLESNLESRRCVIEVIRQLRPTLVFGPYWEDLHPDHAAAGSILRSAMYPSGFTNYPAEGDPYRPNEYLFYMAHTPFQPSLIVDITGFLEKKMEAVRCFSSQVDTDPSGPTTVISQPDFLKKLEARAVYFGSLIGKSAGEPFLSCRPVPMDDPLGHYDLFPGLYPKPGGKEQ